jgi:hypothetical protein
VCRWDSHLASPANPTRVGVSPGTGHGTLRMQVSCAAAKKGIRLRGPIRIRARTMPREGRDDGSSNHTDPNTAPARVPATPARRCARGIRGEREVCPLSRGGVVLLRPAAREATTLVAGVYVLSRHRLMDTTIKAGAHYAGPDPHSPRYLGDPRHYWMFLRGRRPHSWRVSFGPYHEDGAAQMVYRDRAR